MTGEPGAHWIPTSSYGGLGSNMPKTYIVIHKTAGGGSGRQVALDFQHRAASTHYVIDRDGTVYQCVDEDEYAWGNGIFQPGHASFLRNDINPNRYTISIEHFDEHPQNATPLTEAQKQASFRLILHICQRHSIPMRPGDAAGGIIKHSDIEPGDRKNCPGNYPWSDLWAFLAKGGRHMIDLKNADLLTYFDVINSSQIKDKKNGHTVQKGILNFYLAYGGDAFCGLTYLGMPLSEETGVPGKTNCVIQHFERGRLAYDPKHQLDSPPGAGDVYLMHVEAAAPLPPTPAQVLEDSSEQHYMDILKQIEALAKNA